MLHMCIPYVKSIIILFIISHSHPSAFYWGHQCSWTLTLANSMQASIMETFVCNRKEPDKRQGMVTKICLRWSLHRNR